MTTDIDNTLKLTIQSFEELSTSQLYEILKVRAAVFVVEQECAYQDLDGIDRHSMHVTLWRNHKIVAYARVFKDDDDLWHIGRVLTTERNKHFGLVVMREAIKVAKAQDAECIETVLGKMKIV